MTADYTNLLDKIDQLLLSGETRENILKSTCDLLKDQVYHYDWVGIYLSDDHNTNLLLGPYCGKSTEHTLIPYGKGVCGQVAESGKLIVVQDVSLEGNYIACSLDVQSEIVVPILKENKFVAELDIDSHSPSPFTSKDEEFLTLVCQKLSLLF